MRDFPPAVQETIKNELLFPIGTYSLLQQGPTLPPVLKGMLAVRRR